jgi:hypothetical protein
MPGVVAPVVARREQRATGAWVAGGNRNVSKKTKRTTKKRAIIQLSDVRIGDQFRTLATCARGIVLDRRPSLEVGGLEILVELIYPDNHVSRLWAHAGVVVGEV